MNLQIELPDEWVQEIRELAEKIGWTDGQMMLSLIRAGINDKQREPAGVSRQ